MLRAGNRPTHLWSISSTRILFFTDKKWVLDEPMNTFLDPYKVYECIATKNFVKLVSLKAFLGTIWKTGTL